MLLQHGQTAINTTAILIRALVEAIKLETRMSGKFSKIPFVYQDLVTDTWLEHLWWQFQHLDIHLLTNALDFTLQRQHDIEVMHLFIQGGYKGQELICSNHCWIHLHATWLSDLCCSGSQETCQLAWTWIKSVWLSLPMASYTKAIRQWLVQMATCSYGHPGIRSMEKIYSTFGTLVPLGYAMGWFLDLQGVWLWYGDTNGWQCHSHCHMLTTKWSKTESKWKIVC